MSETTQASIQALKRYKVIWSYKPIRPDEMPLDAGDDVLVAKEYEDGWMRGIKLDTREAGFFPAAYVQPKRSPIYGYQGQSISMGEIDVKFCKSDPNRRAKVFLEMYLTEKEYHDRMTMLHERFVLPLAAFSVLDPEDYSIVFSRILPMLNLSADMLALLGSRVEAWQDPTTLTGDLFIYKHREMEDLFTSYAAKHVIGQKVLERVSSKGKVHLSKIEQDCGRTLNSLTIEPIQRITRYRLLLLDLQKATHRGHPDWLHLEEATSLVSEVNRECDDCTKRMQSKLALVLITKQFPHDDVSLVRLKTKKGKANHRLSRQVAEVEDHSPPQPEPGFEHSSTYQSYFSPECRELVREGSVQRGKGGWSTTAERQLILLTDVLLVAQPLGGKRRSFSLKDRIPLERAWITDQNFNGKVPDECFVVGSPKDVHYLIAADASSKMLWFEDIRKHIFQQKKVFNKFLNHLTVPDQIYHHVKARVELPYLAMVETELSLARDEDVQVLGCMVDGRWTPSLYPPEEMLDPSEEWLFGFNSAQSLGWFPKGCVKLVRPTDKGAQPPMLPVAKAFKIRNSMLKIRGQAPFGPVDQERHVRVTVAEGHVKTVPIEGDTTVMDVVSRCYPLSSDHLQWLLYEKSNDGTVNRLLSAKEDLSAVVDQWGRLKAHMHFHLQPGSLVEGTQGHSEA